MRKFTDDNEIALVKSTLDQCKNLGSFLDSAWLEKELLQTKERIKIHPLFWLLLDEVKSRKLQEWLVSLNNALLGTKFSGMLNKLRNHHGRIEFYSLLSEIEVAAFYARRQIIEYEPPHGDLKTIINGIEVFIEIARLFSSREEDRINSLSQRVWSELDDLDANKYVLSFSISLGFSESDVEPFVESVRKTVVQKFTVFPSEKFLFEGGKASVTILCRSEKEKGFVGGNLIGVMLVDTAGRLKKKLLDEINQLPKDKLNIVVYNITHVGVDFDDVEDAFLGQAALRVYVNKLTHASWTEPIRKANGAIHEERGQQISAAIAYKDFNYENRRIYPNLTAKTLIPPAIRSEL